MGGKQRSVRSYAAVSALVLVVAAWVFADRGSRHATDFRFAGVAQDCVVPAGVCRIRIEVVGAAGGLRGTAGAPGAGAGAIAGFAVTPGETLRVRVGGWGGEAMG
ncbi:MAG: hypothetical protein ACXWZB_01485, partial [Gaiellaceae bacterium]